MIHPCRELYQEVKVTMQGHWVRTMGAIMRSSLEPLKTTDPRNPAEIKTMYPSKNKPFPNLNIRTQWYIYILPSRQLFRIYVNSQQRGDGMCIWRYKEPFVNEPRKVHSVQLHGLGLWDCKPKKIYTITSAIKSSSPWRSSINVREPYQNLHWLFTLRPTSDSCRLLLH